MGCYLYVYENNEVRPVTNEELVYEIEHIKYYLYAKYDENGNVVAVFKNRNEVNKYSLGDLFLVIDKGGLPMKLDTNTGILYEQF